jgi:hypothetical protein
MYHEIPPTTSPLSGRAADATPRCARSVNAPTFHRHSADRSALTRGGC